MKQLSETGHAKNIANLSQLHSIASAMGDLYKPARPDLETAALADKLIKCTATLDSLNLARSRDEQIINDRRILYRTLSPLMSRVKNTLKISLANKETLDDAAGYIAKIRGLRRGPSTAALQAKQEGTDAEVPKRNTIRASFDLKADNFSKLVALIGNFEGYATKEEGLTLEALTELDQVLKNANKAVADSKANMHRMRKDRDYALYAPNVGLVDIAAHVKSYVRSLTGGAKNADSRVVNRIRFSKPRNIQFD